MAQMTGGEAVVAALEALGVTHVFGIVSVHNLPIVDALERRRQERGDDAITFICARHEQGATHAADGYARATGRLGVALTSTGPGAANAVPGIYEAQYGSSPVLMLTGQAETRFYGKRKGFLHEAEGQVAMFTPLCRLVESVRRTEDIGRIVVDVADDLRTGRPQPGVIEIPIDLQYATAEIAVPVPRGVTRVRTDGVALARAAELLSGAERPLIWAGGGVVSAGASAELEVLATALDAPVLTTVEGRGALPETHRLCLGPRTDRPQLAGVIAEADVVLAVGTRFQNYATRMWQLPIPGQLIHLDADPGVIGLNYPATVAVVGDARDGLAGLARLVRGGASDSGFVDRARKSVDADLEQTRDEIGADHWALCAAVRRLLPDDAIIARDSTVPVYLWGNRSLPILQPRTSIRPSSVAIGPGLALGVGAAAGTGRRTLVMAGDGGVMLGLPELAVAAEYRLPLILTIFNDRGYGVLRQLQDAVMGRRANVDLHTPDFVKVADGMGVPAERVASVAAFEAAFARAVDRPGPTVLDVDITAMEPLRFPIPAHQRRRED
jgi:acetolactate synthase-1/2/3 large subunit